MRFRKLPVEIEAVRFTGDNWAEMHEFTGHITNEVGSADVFREANGFTQAEYRDIAAQVWDKLHWTWVGVKVGQWIVKGTEGEFYPCADNGSGSAPLNYERIQ